MGTVSNCTISERVPHPLAETRQSRTPNGVMGIVSNCTFLRESAAGPRELSGCRATDESLSLAVPTTSHGEETIGAWCSTVIRIGTSIWIW